MRCEMSLAHQFCLFLTLPLHLSPSPFSSLSQPNVSLVTILLYFSPSSSPLLSWILSLSHVWEILVYLLPHILPPAHHEYP